MERMTWEEMRQMYPDEWIAIDQCEGDLEHAYGAISGMVLVHHSDEREFTQQLKQLASADHLIDIRYTGEWLPDNPIGPVLWQISHTTS